MCRWRVVKRNGQWRVLDRGFWYETHDTLPQAHTAATQLAVSCELFEPGGLTRLKAMRHIVAWRWDDDA